MLYSKEILTVQDTEQEVFLYLKKVKNHSYRISGSKISMTLPNRYTNPDTINKYKLELLNMIQQKLEAEPKWLKRKSLFENKIVSIMNEPFQVINSAEYGLAPINFENREIFWTNAWSEKTKSSFIKKIVKQYSHIVENRVRYWNQVTIQGRITNVNLKNNLTTWGLCSNRGEITISVHTLFAPLWVIDYVIIHELCHLVHHDHSVEFWRLVETFYPKYKQAKKFLKEKGMELSY
ncbi:MAG: M48 family metallopeptidase [Chitinophagales bacterium]|nr:M48 family metallopeptidase [Chitinophagales bacterium]